MKPSESLFLGENLKKINLTKGARVATIRASL